MANVTCPPDADTTFERLPNEPIKAWNAFRRYRDMGYDRTLDSVRKALSKRSGYLRQLQEWSGTYGWVKRSRLFDEHIERRSRQESERFIPLWEQRRQESLEANMAIAARLRERVQAMLDHPITKEIVKEDLNGRSATYIVPCNWTFSSIAAMVKTLAELEAATIAEGLLDEDSDAFDASTATLDQCRDYIERNRRRSKGA